MQNRVRAGNLLAWAAIIGTAAGPLNAHQAAIARPAAPASQPAPATPAPAAAPPAGCDAPKMGRNTIGQLIVLSPARTLEQRIEDAPADSADYYTRPVITLGLNGVSDSLWEYDTRNYLDRMLGRRFSLTYTVRVDTGRFAVTQPLVTYSHDSSTKGENFTRDVHLGARQFPLFRVGADSASDVARLTFEARVATGRDSSVAASVLNATQQVIGVVTPAAKVITTLDAQRNRDLANAVDTTINQFFSARVGEKLTDDLWLRGNDSYGFCLYPLLKGLRSRENGQPLSAIALGNVRFEQPRLSLFDSKTCKLANRGCDIGSSVSKDIAVRLQKRPHEIMAFKLVDGSENYGSIGSYLKSQTWWEAGVSAIRKANGAPAKRGLALGLCRRVIASLESVGLTSFDGHMVADALGKAAMVDPEEAEALSSACAFDGSAVLPVS